MLAQKCILVVVDNEINRATLCGLLASEYRILEAENGQEALDILKEKKDDISLILLDITMPVMDGYTFLSIVKKDVDLSTIPVIVTTQSDSDADEVAALTHGAEDFVTKPYKAEQIYKVLDDASSYVSDNSKYIEVMCDRRNTLISLKEIVSVESDAHYINIGVVSGLRYRTRMTIAEFLKLANNDTRFIPVNRGIVLNADYIKDFEGSVCVTGNGERFPIKIREKTRIEQSIREYMFKKIRENQRR